MARFLQRNRKWLWVVAILTTIGAGAAAIVPSILRFQPCGGPELACIKLMQIAGAKEQWALETHQSTNAPVVVSAVDQYIKGGGPKCPQRGTYTYGNVDQAPHCSVPGHSL
jgi:hypothetical protein